MSFVSRIDSSLKHSSGIFIKNFTESGIDEYTYQKVGILIDDLSEKLIKLGINPKDCVALPYKNTIFTIVFDLALIRIGAYPVALQENYQENSPSNEHGINIKYEIHEVSYDQISNRKFKIIGLLSKYFIVNEVSGYSIEPTTNTTTNTNKKDKAKTYVFGSGTMGEKKCIEILLDNITNDIDLFTTKLSISKNDNAILFLPFSVLQQRILIYMMLFLGGSISLVEPHNLVKLLPRISPTIVIAPPFFYEKMLSNYRARLSVIDNWLGGFISNRMDAKKGLPAIATSSSLLIGYPLRRALGGKVRLMLVGMAMSRESTIKTYHKLGIPLYEAYGLSETGIISINTPEKNKFGTVGKLLLNNSVEIVDGEIVVSRLTPWSVRYTNVNDEVNSYSYPERGVFRTGDKGRFDSDGYLYLKGRIKTEVALSSGFKVQPEDIEKIISESIDVLNVVILGQGYPSLVAVVSVNKNVNMDSVKKDIEELLMNYNSQTSKRGVLDKFVLTKDIFTVENKLLNRSLKIDRLSVEDHYKNDILPLINTKDIEFEI